MVSRKTKQLGIMELTVPNEDRIEVSGELKRLKYEPIAQEGRKRGWRVRIWAVEVGCKGFPAVSMSTFFERHRIQRRQQEESHRENQQSCRGSKQKSVEGQSLQEMGRKGSIKASARWLYAAVGAGY